MPANETSAARELVARGAALPHPSPHLEASVAYGRLLLATEAEADALRRGRARRLRGLPGAARPRAARARRHLRRRRRAPEARALLRAARDTFEALDMGPGAERARGELRAAGEAVRAAAVDPRACCSRRRSCRSRGWPRTGCRNREIGQALYLSHRTIGSNLYRVFPKLGVASRGELRALLAQ